MSLKIQPSAGGCATSSCRARLSCRRAEKAVLAPLLIFRHLKTSSLWASLDTFSSPCRDPSRCHPTCSLGGHCHTLLGGRGDTPARCPTAPGCHIPPMLLAWSKEGHQPPRGGTCCPQSALVGAGGGGGCGDEGPLGARCWARAGAEEPLRRWAASSQPCDCRGGSGPGSVWWGSDTGGSCSWKPSRCWGAPSQQRANARGGENRFGCCLPAQRGVIRALQPLLLCLLWGKSERRK